MSDERSDEPTIYPSDEDLKATQTPSGESGRPPGSAQRRGVTRREVVVGAGLGAAGLAVGLGAGTGLGFALDDEGEQVVAGASGPPVKFGNSVPLTGFASGDGQDMMRGYKMAVSLINSRGGIAGRPVQLVALNGGEFAPDVMVNNFKRLVTEFEVDALIGGYQTNAGPEIDVAATAGVPYYHNSTLQVVADKVAANPEKYWGIFQHDPTEIWYSRSLPDLLDSLEREGKWKPLNNDVAILNANNTYSAGLTSEFRRVIEGKKWKVSLVEQVTVPNTEWGPTLAKLRNRPPGVIWMTDYFPGDEAAFMKQFMQDPTPSIIHMQYGPSVPEFLKLAEDAGNGVMWASVIALIQDDIGKAWAAEYERRFKQKPGFSQGGATYDSTLFWATAASLASGADDHRKVAEVTKQLIFRGVTGARKLDPKDLTDRPYPTFTKDPSLGMPTQYFQIQNGEHVVIFPDPYLTGEFEPPPWLAS